MTDGSPPASGRASSSTREAAAGGCIGYEQAGPVARVVIDHPARRNALTLAMWRALGDRFETLGRDESVRVVVLTGAGDLAFSAGNDISEFPTRRHTPDQVAAYDATTARAYAAIRALEVPIVARIAGVAVGGGFELTQLADLQIAADSASFAMTPAKLGLGYKLEDVELLVERVGARAARELLLTGRRFPAADAARMGLVTRVVPAAGLDEAVDAYAAEIAANAPLAVRAIKVAVAEAQKPPGERDRERCRALAARCNASEDYLEGQRAFAARRPPRFRGR